jgi:hypothetical protein
MFARKEIDSWIRAAARAMGPWLMLVAGFVAARAPHVGLLTSGFWGEPALAWFEGASLLLGGLLIIAFHPHWSGLAAIPILLFGWYLALCGLSLMAIPASHIVDKDAKAAATIYGWIACGALVAIGLCLTYVGWIAGSGNSSKQ